MAKIRKTNDILTKDEREMCDWYNKDLLSILKKCEGKTIEGTKWDRKTISEVHTSATTYNVYQKCVVRLVEDKTNLIQRINEKEAQYRNARTKALEKQYLREYSQMLEQLKNIKEEYNYYEEKRKEYLAKAIDYNVRIEYARRELGMEYDENVIGAKAPKKR